MTKRNIVCVIAAHPDDEILGCGGTIAKHIDNGDEVHVTIMAEGVTSRKEQRSYEKDKLLLEELKVTAQEVNNCIGSTSVRLFDLPDNRMDSLELLDVIKLVEKVIAEFNPNIIYTHFGSDVNIDHQLTYDAVVTACRPTPNQAIRTVLCFETPSSTEWQPSSSRIPFAPNWFISLNEEQMRKKMAALDVYHSEMRNFPHPRSFKAIEALAQWRGASVGTTYAEAFVLARNIVD